MTRPIADTRCSTCGAVIVDPDGGRWEDLNGNVSCDGGGHAPDGPVLWVTLTTDGVAMNESAYCDDHFDEYDESIVAEADDWDGERPQRVIQHDDLECQHCKALAIVDQMIAEDAKRAAGN